MTAALALVVACNGKKADDAPVTPPELKTVLPNLPLPPDAQPIGTQSGTEATQIVIISPHPVDSVAAYYRNVLSMPPFRLVNEANTDGVISFIADQNGPSLWVTIQSNGTTGSQVTLAGAVVDSSLKAKPNTTRKAKISND